MEIRTEAFRPSNGELPDGQQAVVTKLTAGNITIVSSPEGIKQAVVTEAVDGSITVGSVPVGSLTDTQVVVLDAYRAIVTHKMLLDTPEHDTLRIAVTAALREQDLTWDQFVDFVRK